MLKKSIVLGAAVLVAVPSVAAAQEPPPSPPPASAPEPAPAVPAPVAAPSSAAPQDLDEPPRRGAPPLRGAPPAFGAPAQPVQSGSEAARPNRSGATFEMSIGAGMTRVSVDDGPSESFGGLSGLNVGLGGWVSPSTALTLRIAATSFVEQAGFQDVRFIAGLVGLSMQHMASNELWIGIGGGIGVLTTDQDNVEPETGFAFDFRAGVNLYQSAQNAFHLAIEITPGFYDGGKVTGIGVQLGWQAL